MSFEVHKMNNDRYQTTYIYNVINYNLFIRYLLKL